MKTEIEKHIDIVNKLLLEQNPTPIGSWCLGMLSGAAHQGRIPWPTEEKMRSLLHCRNAAEALELIRGMSEPDA